MVSQGWMLHHACSWEEETHVWEKSKRNTDHAWEKGRERGCFKSRHTLRGKQVERGLVALGRGNPFRDTRNFE